ncbi:unnamed protein product [Lupinus luteus]|uniref:DNA/RNA-binding protein Alba-like domain-containing protein n=1 Tax=Lupinus luteus TaxID=3873 RepID=A0AAV1XLE8_LUPLU
MEAITEGVNNINITDSFKKNRIQVSNTKKPLFFYVNLAKRYMQQHNDVELSALGMAIATVVTVAEILKNNGLAVEKNNKGMEEHTAQSNCSSSRDFIQPKALSAVVTGPSRCYNHSHVLESGCLLSRNAQKIDNVHFVPSIAIILYPFPFVCTSYTFLNSFYSNRLMQLLQYTSTKLCYPDK